MTFSVRKSALSVAACAMLTTAAIAAWTPANAEQITWRLNSSQNPTHPIGQAYEQFAKDVAEATRNTTQQIEVVVYPSGQLYTIDKQFAAVSTGQIQLSEVVPSFSTGEAPALSVADLPFIWPNVDVLWKALDGDYGKLWTGELEKAGNVHTLAFIDNGYVNLFTRTGPLTTPEQLRGLKLRLPGKYYSHWGQQLGVQPVTLSGSEALAAIQNGTIEGHITTDTLYVDRKQYEAAPHVAIFDITAYTYILAANKDAWNGIADDTKAAVTQAAQKFESELRQAMVQATMDYRAQMREHGTVTEMTPEQRAVWEATGKATWDQYVADIPAGKALVDAALAARD